MPTYTYGCKKCDIRLEVNCKMDDRDNQDCEHCGTLLIRGLDSPGLVWSPTRNGGYS